MAFFRNLRSHHLSSLLRHKSTSLSSQASPSPYLSKSHECLSRVSSFLPSSHFQRNFSVTAQSLSPDVTEEQPDTAESTDVENGESTNPITETEISKGTEKKKKKTLDVMFKEAVGLSERQGESETSDEDSGQAMSIEIHELKKRLRDLEREVKRLKGISGGSGKEKNKMNKENKVEGKKNVSNVKEGIPRGIARKLSSSGSKGESDISVRDQLYNVKDFEPLEKLSPELLMLVNRLYDDGYLKTANFMPTNKLDLSYFSTHYSRDFLRSAAERFGKDNQERVKTLSLDDLKRIALFGCPSVIKRTTFIAKRLRAFFRIREETVCGPCVLKSSCQFKYQRVWKKDELYLSDIMRILTLYALEMVPEELEIPAEVKDSVTKLLKEVVIPVDDSKEVAIPIDNSKEVVTPIDNAKEVATPIDNSKEVVTPIDNAV